MALALAVTFATHGQELSIRGHQFYLDGQPYKMYGLRAASASQKEEHTEQLIAALDDYKSYGAHAISVYMQGSSGGYSDPFRDGGRSLQKDHLARLLRIIEACQARDMAVIVGIFYQRALAIDSVRQLQSEAAIYRAVETLTEAVAAYDNVIINIANEQNSSWYQRFEAFDFNDPQNIIDLCRRVKAVDPDRIVGGGGYNDSLNVIIGRSDAVDVLLFDTFHGDIEDEHDSGWHYDHFRAQGVPDKPMINVELFGGWTRQFVPPGVYTGEGKRLHLQEIDAAVQRPGLHVHLHANPWMQGPSDGYPVRYYLGGMGTAEDPGIRWWFAYLKEALERSR